VLPEAQAKAVAARVAGRKVIVDRSTQRLFQRRNAVRSLNALAVEAGAAPLPVCRVRCVQCGVVQNSNVRRNSHLSESDRCGFSPYIGRHGAGRPLKF
jgi:hypothetical protein